MSPNGARGPRRIRTQPKIFVHTAMPILSQRRSEAPWARFRRGHRSEHIYPAVSGRLRKAGPRRPRFSTPLDFLGRSAPSTRCADTPLASPPPTRILALRRRRSQVSPRGSYRLRVSRESRRRDAGTSPAIDGGSAPTSHCGCSRGESPADEENARRGLKTRGSRAVPVSDRTARTAQRHRRHRGSFRFSTARKKTQRRHTLHPRT
jgi:hypothetical protein